MRDYKKEVCSYLDENWDKVSIQRKKHFKALHSAKKVCIFGAGGMGKSISHILTDIGVKIDFFCDNNEILWGKDAYLGLKCISIHDLMRYKDDVLILVATKFYKEVYEQLTSMGFKKTIIMTHQTLPDDIYLDQIDCSFIKDKLCELLDVLEDEKSKEIIITIAKSWTNTCRYNIDFSAIETGDEYFPLEIIKFNDDEIFVDVGAYDGDTIRDLMNRFGNDFNKIIAYELDKSCFEVLEKNVQSIDGDVKKKICLHNLGLLDNNGKIKYISNFESSVVSTKAGEEGEVVRLSDHIKKEKVTYIKMDIEGAEIRALMGAEEIIKLNKPKLAICIYHKPNHLWEIPLYIKSLASDYKIYIRHHSKFQAQTVCYAIL